MCVCVCVLFLLCLSRLVSFSKTAHIVLLYTGDTRTPLVPLTLTASPLPQKNTIAYHRRCSLELGEDPLVFGTIRQVWEPLQVWRRPGGPRPEAQQLDVRQSSGLHKATNGCCITNPEMTSLQR